MNALNIALMACQIFATLEPVVAPIAVAGGKAIYGGLSDLITHLKTARASGRSMSFSEIHEAGRSFGVHMPTVYATTGALALTGAGTLALALGRRR